MMPVFLLAARGYIAALAAGNFTFWVVGLLSFLVFGRPGGGEVGVAGFLVVAAFTLFVSLVTTILPFIVFLAVSLILRVRSWAYFVFCGVAMGLLTTGLLIGAGWTEWRMWALNAALWRQLSLSGAMGGLVFWLVAVRNHGRAAAPRDIRG